MTDKERLVQMLIGAQVSFSERRTKKKQPRHIVEIDNGGGAVAIFEFDEEGILVAFDIDKDAY